MPGIATTRARCQKCGLIRMIDQAKSLLVKELAVAKKMTEAQLLAEVGQIFKA